MKSISFRDVIVSILSSIVIICLFSFVAFTVLLFLLYITLAAIVLVFGIIVYPFVGELLTVSDIFGSLFGAGIFVTSFKLMFTLFTDWSFYVLIIIVSILDLFIRKAKVRIVSDSVYVNGIVAYLLISIVLGFLYTLLPGFQFDVTEFKFVFFTIIIFFLAHFHLTLLLHYILQKGPDILQKNSVFLEKIKSKMKKYSVTENDNEY